MLLGTHDTGTSMLSYSWPFISILPQGHVIKMNHQNSLNLPPGYREL